MPPVKNWQGPGSATSPPDPMAKPNDGPASPRPQGRWQGAYDTTPKPDPTEKPAGSAKIPGGS